MRKPPQKLLPSFLDTLAVVVPPVYLLCQRKGTRHLRIVFQQGITEGQFLWGELLSGDAQQRTQFFHPTSLGSRNAPVDPASNLVYGLQLDVAEPLDLELEEALTETPEIRGDPAHEISHLEVTKTLLRMPGARTTAADLLAQIADKERTAAHCLSWIIELWWIARSGVKTDQI